MGAVQTWALSADSARSAENPNSKRPNILLIYADDVGYSDLGVYGNQLIETPNLDRLADEGMRFTDAYAPAAMCSPSRVALLTGRSPARLNFEFVTKYDNDFYDWDSPEWAQHWDGRELLPPPFTLNLPLEEITLAEALNEAGYATGMVGKWHVAAHHQEYKGWSLTHGPRQQGFEWAAETFGSHGYAYRRLWGLGNFGPFEEGEYPPDELTNRAGDFLRKRHSRPFFLFVSHYYMHTPIDTMCEWLVEKYREKAGGDVPEARLVYAAMMETLDHYVGQLLDVLDEEGLADDTLVIFTSDQGGDPRFAYNRPFRGGKWNFYEGGIRVPKIVRWPGVVEAGSIADTPVIQTDFMPTFRELAGSSSEFGRVLDGVSFVPVLKGEKTAGFEERELIWHFPYYHPEGRSFDRVPEKIGVEDGFVSQSRPHSAMRRGNHKLIYFYEDGRSELYDLSEDPAEENDLSASKSDLAHEMERALLKHLDTVGARFPRERVSNR